MEGFRWGYTFLRTDTRLQEEDRLRIVKVAVDMYFKGQERRTIQGTNYEGVIKAKGEHGVLGTFTGPVFQGEFNIGNEPGKARLEFLISEQTGIEHGGPGSMN